MDDNKFFGRQTAQQLGDEIEPLVNGYALIQGLVHQRQSHGYEGFALLFLGMARHASVSSDIPKEHRECLMSISNIWFAIERSLPYLRRDGFDIDVKRLRKIVQACQGLGGTVKKMKPTDEYQQGMQAAAQFAQQYGAELLGGALFLGLYQMLDPDGPCTDAEKEISAAGLEFMGSVHHGCFEDGPEPPRHSDASPYDVTGLFGRKLIGSA
jgi:hypothetical protein